MKYFYVEIIKKFITLKRKCIKIQRTFKRNKTNRRENIVSERI